MIFGILTVRPFPRYVTKPGPLKKKKTQKFKFLYLGNQLCPVKCYELYINRLDSSLNRLWQQPKDKVTWEDTYWFTGQPLSKNKVGKLMTFLTKDANLSKAYTNHCVRSTCITVLDKENFEARHIMTVSGHKREESIKSYSTVTSDPKKREMSNALASALVTKTPETPKKELIDQVDNKDENLEIRELLQMTPEEEKHFLKEIFSDFEPDPLPVSVNTTNSSIQNRPSLQNVMPKMVLNNSTVTINFNFQR